MVHDTSWVAAKKANKDQFQTKWSLLQMPQVSSNVPASNLESRQRTCSVEQRDNVPDMLQSSKENNSCSRRTNFLTIFSYPSLLTRVIVVTTAINMKGREGGVRSRLSPISHLYQLECLKLLFTSQVPQLEPTCFSTSEVRQGPCLLYIYPWK